MKQLSFAHEHDGDLHSVVAKYHCDITLVCLKTDRWCSTAEQRPASGLWARFKTLAGCSYL